MKKVALTEWESLPNQEPTHALVADVDLGVVCFDDEVSVLYER